MQAIRRFTQGVTAVIQADSNLYQRFPRLKLAALGMLFVPAIYAGVYLGSVAEPNAKTSALPVGLVNQDSGASLSWQDVKLGDDVSAALEKQGLFGYQRFDDAQSAQQAVQDGKLYFAVVIPKDFSQRALTGTQPTAAKLTVYTSEGNNYVGAGYAKRFAPELAQSVNGIINAKRSEMSAAGSEQSLKKLKEAIVRLNVGASLLNFGLGSALKGSGELEKGTAALKEGAQRLDDGARKLNAGTAELASGMKQLGAGLRTMDAKKPANSDLQALADGARGLAAGEAELGKGLAQLHAGSKQLAGGVRQLKERVPDPSLLQAVAPLDAGAAQLAAGLGKTSEGQAKLAEGARRLEDGTGKLAAGMKQLNDGIHTMASRMPEDAKIDAFAGGMKQLADGTGALAVGAGRLNEGAGKLSAGLAKLNEGSAAIAGGLEQVDAALPAPGASSAASAAGLSGPAQIDLQVMAATASRGNGLAPNLMAVALWMGAVMTAFLFHFRRLPASAQQTPQLSKVFGKLAMPTVIVAAQTVVTLLAMHFLFDARISSLPVFGITLLVAALAFVAIQLALARVFGDAGRGIAVVLLIIQLTSAGALMPVELTSGFYHVLQPYLPVTGVVHALRASLAGAFDVVWLHALGIVALEGVIALLVAAFVGKWKFVKTEEYRPALDTDMPARVVAFPEAGVMAGAAK